MKTLSRSERLKASAIALTIWALGTLLVVIIVRDTRERASASHALSTLAEALQAYSEKRGSMPRLNHAPGRDLVKFLHLSGQLPELPINPATMRPYDLASENDPEGITYHSQGNFSGFELSYVRPRDKRTLAQLAQPYRADDPYSQGAP